MAWVWFGKTELTLTRVSFAPSKLGPIIGAEFFFELIAECAVRNCLQQTYFFSFYFYSCAFALTGGPNRMQLCVLSFIDLICTVQFLVYLSEVHLFIQVSTY